MADEQNKEQGQPSQPERQSATPAAEPAPPPPPSNRRFIVFGVVYVLAVFFWAGFDASKPVTPEAHGELPVEDAAVAGAIAAANP